MKYNKLIAEFMGVNPTILGDEITYEMYGIIDCIEDGLDEQHFFLEEELMFYDSWDWLMPVIDKIESLGYELIIAESRCKINHNTDHSIEEVINIDIIGSKREATYQAVVEFIKEYNK